MKGSAPSFEWSMCLLVQDFFTSSVEECMVNMRVDIQDWLFSPSYDFVSSIKVETPVIQN